MVNRLQNEISPYLLQHAENPVDWYPWGAEAISRAKQEDKPIFLSIGYAACHWCHVMAHESFEDPETARILNENFINIKVDREERPELDQIYMDAVVALTGQGGWPMSIFLTPEGQPFYGGTYFPPVRRYNMPSFPELLVSIAQAWQNDRASLLANAEKIVEHLAKISGAATGVSQISAELLNQAALTLAQNYDWQHGGWGRAPKFPQPMLIEFLLQRATRGDRMSREISEHVLIQMAKGGMYDVIGGGFARYSTDNHWLVPHFEKMLYDNALLARVYLYAYLMTGSEANKQVCLETLDFVLREMTHPAGGFYSSLDADTDGEEGKFYVWDLQEINSLLSELESEIIIRAFGITAAGNFEGSNILQRQLSDDQLAAEFNLPIETLQIEIASARSKLLAARERRVRPATDDKVLTAWNGLMLRTMAEAAAYLGRQDYLFAAQKNAAFILENLRTDGRLHRAWRAGQTSVYGFLEDYASLVLGLLALYQADYNARWYQAAVELIQQMISLFSDPVGGFFDTPSDHEELIMRPKSVQDSAVPCGNSLAALSLLQIGAYTGENQYYEYFEEMIGLISGLMDRYPTAIGNWLVAADFSLGPVYEIAVLAPEGADNHQKMTAVFREKYRPRMLIARSTPAGADQGPPLLRNRPLLDNALTAYVCQGFICQQPVTDPEAFAQQLDSA